MFFKEEDIFNPDKIKAKKKIKRIIFYAISLLIIIAIIFSIQVMHKINSDTFYTGIHVGNVDLSGLTVEEAATLLIDNFSFENGYKLRLHFEDEESFIDPYNDNLSIDIEKTLNNAYSFARYGSKIKRIKLIREIRKNGAYFPFEFENGDEYLINKINEIAEKTGTPEQEMSETHSDNEIVIKKGTEGFRIVPQTHIHSVKRALSMKSTDYELYAETVYPTEPTAENITKMFCGDAKNASYKIKDQKLIVIPEKDGIQIDLQQTKDIIKKTKDDTYIIPAKITKPSVTSKDVTKNLFNDLLAEYSTKYSESSKARSDNIKLACEKINNSVLDLKDVFSYNYTVGKRTEQNGFKEANVYVENRIESGIGGGICQVSSTLFNAAVLADLNIVSRTGHSLPVSYVPLGRDATVSDNSIDFKFENNSYRPIKIVATAANGINSIKIYGTKNTNNRIEISTECIETKPPETETITDPTLAAGTVVVDTKGSAGSSYVTYKIVKDEKGTLLKNDVLCRTTYNPINRVERVSDKDKSVSNKDAPTETKKP